MSPITTTVRPAEITPDDVDQFITQLERSWEATITIRRQSKHDVGYRDIYIAVDDKQAGILHAGEQLSIEVKPGSHRIKAHNTLFRKHLDVTLAPGEHATFSVINKAGFGTYSVLAFFMGGGPLYLTLERETNG